MKKELQVAIAQLYQSQDVLYACYASERIISNADVENTLFYNLRGLSVLNPLMRHGLTFERSYQAPPLLPSLPFEAKHYYHYEGGGGFRLWQEHNLLAT